MLRIRHHHFESPFILAPLAGYSDLPFRILCRRYGAGFCVSEMISCHGLVYQQANTLGMLRSIAEEKPVSFQLFGADPEIMEEAALILESYGPEMIDINMGCPVKKVTKRGAGAALMTNLPLAAEIISRISRKVHLPVTIKIRAGKDTKNINAVELAKIAEDSGAAAIAVHGRTWSQGFSGVIDPVVIKAVKNSVNIPVIGNGDIHSLEQGKDLMNLTGCDGVMIGRGAMGNPWVFSKQERPSTLSGLAAGAREHLDLICQYLPAKRIPGYLKNQMSRYFKGLPGCSGMRERIFAAADLNALKKLLHHVELS
jgi:tRNA-dihydrouridine synthase B